MVADTSSVAQPLASSQGQHFKLTRTTQTATTSLTAHFPLGMIKSQYEINGDCVGARASFRQIWR
jgi:hypothetical protein